MSLLETCECCSAGLLLGEHSTVRKEVGGGDGKGVRARTGTPAALSPDHRWVVRLFTFLCPRKVQV